MTSVPFDPSVPDPFVGRRNLNDVIRLELASFGRELRVCLPCKVVRVRGNQLVDVQPLLQARFKAAAGPTTLPVVANCPVSMPSGLDWSVKYPLAEGDLGMCVFSDRSLDVWLASSGQPVLPDDTRTHALTDAIYVPGLLPQAQQTTDTTTDLVIRNGTAQVRLEKNGTFRVANQNQELVDLIGQMNAALAKLVGTLSKAQTITMLGPQPLWAATQAELTQAAATLQTLGQNLQTLKGQ